MCKVSLFWVIYCARMQNKVNFSFRLEDCLMTFSDNTLQRLWRQYCKVYSFLSHQKCLTGRGNLADWALAMPCCQSVWQINLSLWNETLSNCVDLKETLVSLRHYKVSGEMSKKPILLIPTLSSWYIMTWQNVCVWIIFTVYASVPLREQTCHVSKFDTLQLDNLSKGFSYDLFFVVKEGRQVFFNDQGKKRLVWAKAYYHECCFIKVDFLPSFEMYRLTVS